jgi:hypothetical protein
MRRRLPERGGFGDGTGVTRPLVLVSFMLLAACGQKSAVSSDANSEENQAVALNSVNAASSAGNAALNEMQPNSEVSTNETESGNAIGSLPPATAELRFVGLWATDKANCASHGWRFTADALTGPDAPHCSLYKVTKMPRGYDLAARCPAKKPVELDLIKLRFAESARAMLVESNAIEPTGLIYCGE